MSKIIYGYEGNAIGENVNGRICWYYSDGAAGGQNGGHYMDTMEFMRFNGINAFDEEDIY